MQLRHQAPAELLKSHPVHKERSRKLVVVRERWTHMASVSGFDPLFAELQSSSPGHVSSLFIEHAAHSNNPVVNLYRRVRDRRHERLRASAPFPACSVSHERAAADLLQRLENDPNALGVLSVAESQLGGHLIGAAASIKKRLIICLHQPPSQLRLYWKDHSILRDVGAVVCLGGNLVDHVKEHTEAPVWHLKHGVNLDFFRPHADVPKVGPQRLIFVGHWLRDFEVLQKAFALIRAARPDVELDCVVPTDRRNNDSIMKLARDPLVHWHAGISAEALRDLYARATLMFLPLADCVANNGIVEALSSGLPIVTSRIGAIDEYVPSDCGTLCAPDDPEDHARAVLHWLELNRRNEARPGSRAFAQQHLDWAVIARQFTSLAEKLHSAPAECHKAS
jgi:glycosyltransferase involved in cell wall biosynthesis